MKKILILALLFMGCFLSEEPTLTNADKEQNLLNRMKGKHYSHIIEKMGAYARTAEDGKGGTIYIWETYEEAQTHTNVNPLYGRTILGVKQDNFLYETQTQSASSSMQVMCYPDGIIYNVIYKSQGY